MAGGYFGNRYFPGGYFPDSYFGTEGEANPNAMSGLAAGSASVTGVLSVALGAVEVGGFGSGGGFGDRLSRRGKRRARDEEDLLLMLMAA